MRRIVSLWLPRWPTDRLYRSLGKGPRQTRGSGAPGETLDRRVPLALVTAGQGGWRITALNDRAAEEGLHAGQLLADARALCPELTTREAEPRADAEGLEKVAAWCGRYTPWTAVRNGDDGEDGIFLDISGCGHLFGGDDALVRDLLQRLRKMRIAARAGLAGTPGAAWAFARYGDSVFNTAPPDKEHEALCALPVAALRLEASIAEGLAQLGLKCIADVMDKLRAPLTARFGEALMTRLDQALGRADEPISPRLPVVPYRARLVSAEALTHVPAIEQGIARMAEDLARLLEADGKGARRLELILYRVDGDVTRLGVGTSQPARDPTHLCRLFKDKLDGLGSHFDAGYGIETMSLEARTVEPLDLAQQEMDKAQGGRGRKPSTDLGCLIDRLGNRLGVERVVRSEPRASHIPERAVTVIPAIDGLHPADDLSWQNAGALLPGPARPLLMLPCAEPVEVIAEVPEGPPKQFRWRRVLYHVARADGPERIAPEWWRTGDAAHMHSRDYYRLEDADGRRFWLYREGLYGRETAAPKWYLHGVFA